MESAAASCRSTFYEWKAVLGSKVKQPLSPAGDPAARGLRPLAWPHPDPRDLLKAFPSELLTMWPLSTRVNTPKNDDPDLLVPFVEASAEAPLDGNST
jgi:hypothetical protein